MVKKFMDKRKAGYVEMEEKTKANLAASEQTKAEYETKLQEAKQEAEEGWECGGEEGVTEGGGFPLDGDEGGGAGPMKKHKNYCNIIFFFY